MSGIMMDGYSIPRTILLSIEYWAYCLYLIPLFVAAAVHMLRRRERRWAKTVHRGEGEGSEQ